MEKRRTGGLGVGKLPPPLEVGGDISEGKTMKNDSNLNEQIRNVSGSASCQASADLEASQDASFVPESTNDGAKAVSLLHPSVQRKLDDMPRIYRATYRKAMSGKSLRAAVNSFCLECVGWQREEVRLCTSPACPLYPYRPYQ